MHFVCRFGSEKISVDFVENIQWQSSASTNDKGLFPFGMMGLKPKQLQMVYLALKLWQALPIAIRHICYKGSDSTRLLKR